MYREWHLLRLPALVGAKRSVSVLWNTSTTRLFHRIGAEKWMSQTR